MKWMIAALALLLSGCALSPYERAYLLNDWVRYNDSVWRDYQYQNNYATQQHLNRTNDILLQGANQRALQGLDW